MSIPGWHLLLPFAWLRQGPDPHLPRLPNPSGAIVPLAAAASSICTWDEQVRRGLIACVPDAGWPKPESIDTFLGSTLCSYSVCGPQLPCSSAVLFVLQCSLHVAPLSLCFGLFTALKDIIVLVLRLSRWTLPWT